MAPIGYIPRDDLDEGQKPASEPEYDSDDSDYEQSLPAFNLRRTQSTGDLNTLETSYRTVGKSAAAIESTSNIPTSGPSHESFRTRSTHKPEAIRPQGGLRSGYVTAESKVSDIRPMMCELMSLLHLNQSSSHIPLQSSEQRWRAKRPARYTTHNRIKTLSAALCKLFREQTLDGQHLLADYEPKRRRFGKQSASTYEALLHGYTITDDPDFEQRALDPRYWQDNWDWVPLGTSKHHQAIADLSTCKK